jgi:hypothetical protein
VAFYLNLCIAAVVAPGHIFWLPYSAPTSRSNIAKERIKSLYLLGAILFPGYTAAFTMIISLGDLFLNGRVAKLLDFLFMEGFSLFYLSCSKCFVSFKMTKIAYLQSDSFTHTSSASYLLKSLL